MGSEPERLRASYRRRNRNQSRHRLETNDRGLEYGVGTGLRTLRVPDLPLQQLTWCPQAPLLEGLHPENPQSLCHRPLGSRLSGRGKPPGFSAREARLDLQKVLPAAGSGLVDTHSVFASYGKSSRARDQERSPPPLMESPPLCVRILRRAFPEVALNATCF